MFQVYLKVLLIVYRGELITIEDPSLRPHDYQLLPLATSQLVANNKEFDVSGKFFELFHSLVDYKACNHWRSITDCP